MDQDAKRRINGSCYRKLRRLILHGQIRPGIRLGEVEWSRRLGVHRGALREAMVVLAHDGLLRQGERGGFFTPLLEQRDLDEILETRAVIEVGALRLSAARQLGAAELAPLLRICDSMQQLLDDGLEFGFVDADRKFHEKLVELSGNERLIDLYRRAPLPLILPAEPDPEARREKGLLTIREHREIHQLLLTQQIPAAVAMLEHHLSRNHYMGPIYT